MSGPGEVPRDCLTSALCATIAAVGLAALAIAAAWPAAPKLPPVEGRASRAAATEAMGRQIARPGEWVTSPDGARVCRLRAAITSGMTFTRGVCEEWQGPIPEWAQSVPWLRLSREGYGMQIMVEGEWRP